MTHLPQIPRRTSPDDQLIEAVVRGEPVDPVHEPWAALARRLREIAGDGPVPVPNDELACILRGEAAPGHPPSASPVRRVASLTAKVAALGAAKVVLGATLAAAGVTGAGVAGVLPDAADDAVRDAVETVTPLHLEEREPDHHPEDVGDQVADDATGDSDGEPGVDGPSIAEDAPGSEHRPEGAGPPEHGPGRPDARGPDGTPTGPASPGTTPVPDPDPDADADPDPAPAGGRPPVVPSTVPVPPTHSHGSTPTTRKDT